MGNSFGKLHVQCLLIFIDQASKYMYIYTLQWYKLKHIIHDTPNSLVQSW